MNCLHVKNVDVGGKIIPRTGFCRPCQSTREDGAGRPVSGSLGFASFPSTACKSVQKTALV